MPNFCLIAAEVDRFKQALVGGQIDPAKLANMTSAERHGLFSDIVGEHNAMPVNALFESKLLLKNQQRGMVTWAKTVAGLKPEVRRDLISRIGRLDQVLNPAEQKQFLNDLASTKLGIGVTREEAKKIALLSRKIDETRATMESGGDRLAHGRAKVALENYVLDKKQQANKISLFGYAKRPTEAISNLAGQAKAINASMDNSAIFRQGWKTLWTNPITWQKNARRSFVDLVRQLGNKPVMDEVRADIISRPNADLYRKMGLDVGTLEEPFPTHLPSKIPVVGRLYHASESAYTGFVYRMRADVADKYLQIAQKSGVNLGDKAQLQSIGDLVNSLTGRGRMGRLEPAAGVVNNLFFSPRFLKSNVDFLTAHQFQKGVTPFVRKRAALNLLKVISGSAAVLATANAVKPGSVEFDPRSSNFGKIKIGDTRFDVSGGMASVATLAARLATMSTKSSVTGEVKKLNSGNYGAETGSDVVYNFFENKLSPAAGVARDILKGQDFKGNKPTVLGEAKNLVTPLSVSNYFELKNDPHSANILASAIADGLGLVTNTYGQPTVNWNHNPSKETKAFRGAVGQKKFDQANKEYNRRLGNFNQKIFSNPEYKNLPQEQQQTLITDAKEKLKKQIFIDNGFTYKRQETSQTIKDSKEFLLKASGL